MGVIFGVAKKDTTGGSEGVAFFGRNFSRLSFLNTSLRNTLVIQHLCYGLKYRLQEFYLRSGLKLDLDLTPSHMLSAAQVTNK